MGKLKIAFLHNEYPFGGGEKVTSNLSEYFNENNCQVYVFACRFLINKDRSNILITLPESKKIDTKKNIDFLITEIQKEQIDILVLPGIYIKRLDLIKNNTKVKLIFALHSVPLWEATNKRILAKAKSRQGILKSLEWILLQKIKYDYLNTHIKSTIKKYTYVYNIVDAYVVLCEQYREDMLKILNLESSVKLKAILNASENQDVWNSCNKTKTVLYVGRLSYADKRVDRLLDIWSKIYLNNPDWILKIVGDGPERHKLQDLANQLHLKRVSFEGYHSDISEYYKDSSIICLTSTFEGWGLCLAEAQAHGVIPIAFNCSAGVNQIISPNGVNGFLINPFEVTQFANQLEELMQDEEIRKRMAKAVQQKSKEYSLSNIGKQWLDLFNELMSR